MVDPEKRIVDLLSALMRIDELLQKHENQMSLYIGKYLNEFSEMKSGINGIVCKNLGHDFSCDQCGKPEHDYCLRCGVRACVLGYVRAEDYDKTGNFTKVEK